MPMDRTRYPDNWNEIALAVKEKAGWKCEECGAAHNQRIIRNPHNTKLWRAATERDYFNYADLVTKVIMTVHHVGVQKPDGTPGDPEDKMDCRPENLKCLCQRCHLAADQELHLSNASETRAKIKRQSQLEAGQGELF